MFAVMQVGHGDTALFVVVVEGLSLIPIVAVCCENTVPIYVKFMFWTVEFIFWALQQQ